MFNKLLRLYKQNSKKTPLEDYTTEIFVGVLNSDLELKNYFCNDYLKLTSSNYKISTQKHYYLKNEPKCIVDIVIEGENDICFIENKVNSKEGYNQLERYSKVLDNIKIEKKIETKLCYCTKKYDKKKFTKHNFKQFKWHNIAMILSKFQKEKLTQHFIHFLKTNDMANDMIIEATDLITFEKLSKTINLIQRNIQNVRTTFESKFNISYDGSKGKKMLDQLNNFDRICITSENIVKDNGYSEILYGFETNGKIVIQIYINSNNSYYKKFIEILKNIENFNSNFKSEMFDHGSRIYLERNLGEFINDENSENEIKNWFEKGFEIMEDFIKNEKNISWILK